jgi:serine phosphatase RsbU (regulator of sigma subunit)
MRKKSVQAGILKVSLIGLLLLVVCFGGYYYYELKKFREMKYTAEKSFENILDKILAVNFEKFYGIVKDNSAWDELHDAVSNYDLEAINENIGYMQKSYSAENISVFDINGKKVFSKSALSSPDDLFPFEGKKIAEIFEDKFFVNFFEEKSGKLMAYIGAGIVSSADEYTRKEKPVGFLFLVKEISEKDLRNFEKQIGNVKAYLFYDASSKDDFVKNCEQEYIVKEIRGYEQNISAYFCLTYTNPIEKQLNESLLVILIVGGEVLLILLNIFLFFRKRVTIPLKKIDRAFKNNNVTPVFVVTKSDDEFGEITRMMVDFFEQKEEILVQNETLQQQKEEISAQNEHMRQLNEELQTVNDDLDKQKKFVEEQNRIISLSNKQMTDSISYASRLQGAMLLAHSPKEGWFSDRCSFYFPKEIVGGDFYVAQSIGTKHIAVLGDCTGHGVPGAVLVSMGISFLYQIIDFNECNLMPNNILKCLREKVISSFGIDKDGGMRNDGMDVAVVVYDTETKEAYFSGAQRPCVIVKNNEILEIKGDKMPIGRYIKDGDFTCVKLDICEGDQVYLYSDGCTDQVGGEKKRKIMSKNFRNKILEFSSLPMSEQAEKLSNFIFDYKGNNSQTDDIALIAFKI